MAEYNNPATERALPALIPCGGIVLRAHNLDATLQHAANESFVLLRRPDPVAAAPDIRRVEILAKPGKSHDEQNGLIFQGMITTRGRLPSLLRDASFANSFVHSGGGYQPVEVQLIEGHPSAIHMQHVLGMEAIGIIGGKNLVITNNHVSGCIDKVYRPLPIGTMELRSQLAAFGGFVMHALDYLARYSAKGDYGPVIFDLRSVPLPAPEEQADEAATDTEAVTFGDISGLEDQCATLKNVAYSFKHPEILKKWQANRPTGVLLHGPPGCGKTLLIKALGHEIGAEVWDIQSSDIYDKWVGDTEAQVKKIFSDAQEHDGPLILFFDEIDGIISQSDDSDGGNAVRNHVFALFKQEADRLAHTAPHVLIAGATNEIGRVEPAVQKRFSYVMAVPMPNEAARATLIATVIHKTIPRHTRSSQFLTAIIEPAQAKTDEPFSIYDKDIDTPQLAALTADMSGSDIAEILRRLQFDKAMHESRYGSATPISQAEIEAEIKKFRQRR